MGKQIDFEPSPLAFSRGADGLPTMQQAQRTALLPATPENLICQVGPCKHYRAVVMQAEDENPDMARELNRYCTKLASADELMDLTDGSVFGCNCYKPPLWSIQGWIFRIRNWRFMRKLLGYRGKGM